MPRAIWLGWTQMIKTRHTIALVAALIAGVAASYLVPKPLPRLTRGEFMAEVRAGHVHRIEIKDQDVIIGDSGTRGKFRADFDRRRDSNLPGELRKSGIEVRFSTS